jgi:hypothetical protein
MTTSRASDSAGPEAPSSSAVHASCRALGHVFPRDLAGVGTRRTCPPLDGLTCYVRGPNRARLHASSTPLGQLGEIRTRRGQLRESWPPRMRSTGCRFAPDVADRRPRDLSFRDEVAKARSRSLRLWSRRRSEDWPRGRWRWSPACAPAWSGPAGACAGARRHSRPREERRRRAPRRGPDRRRRRMRAARAPACGSDPERRRGRWVVRWGQVCRPRAPRGRPQEPRPQRAVGPRGGLRGLGRPCARAGRVGRHCQPPCRRLRGGSRRGIQGQGR